MPETTEILPPHQRVSWNMKYDTVTHILGGLNLYAEYLRRLNREGNTAIEEALQKVDRLVRSINYQVDRIRERDPDHWDWDAETYELDAQAFSLIKATLPLQIQKLENEKQERITNGEPPEAMQDLEGQLERVREISDWDIFLQVEDYTLIGDNHVPCIVPENEEGGSLTINATINNTGDGVIAVGRDIQVQQSFVETGRLLEELVQLTRQSTELDEDTRSTIEGNARTIEAQLGLSAPNTGIIQSAWDGIQGLATAEGFIQLCERIGTSLIAARLLS